MCFDRAHKEGQILKKNYVFLTFSFFMMYIINLSSWLMEKKIWMIFY